MMNELKPCPFCGATSEDIETVFLGSGMAYIRCSKCMSRCGMRDGVDEAEKLWNSFANTMAIITASEGKLAPELMEGIKLKFAGHYQALQAIKAAFERYEVDLSKYGYDEYICPVGFAIPTLITAAENIEREETSVFIDLMDIFKKIIRFGEVRGIEFSEDAKTFGDGFDEEIGVLFARRVMGLPEQQ